MMANCILLVSFTTDAWYQSCCRRELLSTGKASLSESLLEHCVEHAAELLRTQHGGEVLECLCCGGDVGSWLWDSNRAGVSAVHDAVAAALSEDSATPTPAAPGSTEGKLEDEGGKKIKGVDGETCCLAAHEKLSGSEGSDDEVAVSEDGDGEASEAPQKASGRQGVAVGAGVEVQEDVTENFFATRALKRMVMCAHSASGASFLKQLWSGAIKGNVERLKGTHTCKVIAALAQCPVAAVARGVQGELSEVLQGETVEEFLGKFTKPPKAKGSIKGKVPVKG